MHIAVLNPAMNRNILTKRQFFSSTPYSSNKQEDWQRHNRW